MGEFSNSPFIIQGDLFMKSKKVYPLNLKKKETILWERNELLIATAYIFDNKSQCIRMVKNTIKDIIQDNMVYILIKPLYDELSYKKEFGSLDCEITDSYCIIKGNKDTIDDIFKKVFKFWGELCRFQFFISQFCNTDILNIIREFSKKYRNSYKLYYKLAMQCVAIISDTGDGEEFEIITKLDT